MSPETLPRTWRRDATEPSALQPRSATPNPVSLRRDPSALSDEELVELALEGEASAFELLMRRHERLVFKVAVSFAREREAAMDILQNAFLKAFRGLDRFQPEEPLSFWMRPGTHGVVEEDWPAFLEFLSAHFQD